MNLCGPILIFHSDFPDFPILISSERSTRGDEVGTRTYCSAARFIYQKTRDSAIRVKYHLLSLGVFLLQNPQK